MPTYVYNFIGPDGEPTGEQFETFQRMSDDAYKRHPETGQPCQRAIVAPAIKHTGPAWEWCSATQKYINDTKPKYIRDDNAGIRMRYPKGGV